jgi:hypothetical protein
VIEIEAIELSVIVPGSTGIEPNQHTPSCGLQCASNSQPFHAGQQRVQ